MRFALPVVHRQLKRVARPITSVSLAAIIGILPTLTNAAELPRNRAVVSAALSSAASSSFDGGVQLSAQSPEQTSDVSRFMSNGVAVEVLKGQAALAHLRNLKQKRGQAFAEAESRLAARGFTKTETAVVVRTLSLAAYRAAESPSVLKVQSTITSSEGELVFWSWTDGDPSTWEGTIFMEAYGYGETLSDAQLDIASAATADVIWEDLISYRFDRDGPIILDPVSSPKQTNPRKSRAQLASSSSDAASNYSYVGTGGGNRPENPVKEWFVCTVAGCLGAAAACWIAGPAFFGCFTQWCTAAAVTCLVVSFAKFAL
jgi:hypothetical protein